MHLNLRVDPTQYIQQIRQVPGYDYIHLVRAPKHMTDLSLLNEKVHYLNNIWSKKDFVKEHDIQLMHAHHAQLGLLLLPFKEETGIPLVTSIRGRDATLANQPVNYLESMKELFDKGDCFFPVCHYLAERISDWGCPVGKIKVLYGGVDLEKFRYRQPSYSGSINILSVGRLVEKKGHHILMEAFSRIKDKFPNASLTIVGSGVLKEQLLTLAKTLELGDSFKLINSIHKDRVYEYMQKADIFCAASMVSSNGDVEGIPNTLKEAMASGLPVISTYHAGIPELIDHNKDGLLVEEKNVDELAQALEYMMRNDSTWKNLSLAGRKKVEEKFDLKQQLKQQATFYNELLGG